MSRLQPDFIKRGFWINLEDGLLMGRIITTDTRTGNLVIAVLAVLTAFDISHLWNLLTFLHHQLRVNSNTSDWLKLWWTWRNHTDGGFRRSWLQVSTGTVFTLATVAVGMFASYVVCSSSAQVLVNSPYCGPLDRNWFDDEPSSIGVSTDYMLQVDKLNRTSDKPRFQNDAQLLDSGMLDLNDAFGMNLADRDHVKLRKKTSCAVLDTGGRHLIVNGSDGLTNCAALPNEQFLVTELGDTARSGGVTSHTFVQIMVVAMFDTQFASQKLEVGTSGIEARVTLPDDQWVREMVGCESFVWACLQTVIPDYAIDAGVRDMSLFKIQSNDSSQMAGEKELCRININVFGLAFVITVCSLAIALDLVLLKFHIFLTSFRKALGPRINAWVQDGIYLLQRRAYEMHGERVWKHLGKDLPLTVDKAELAKIPLESRPVSRQDVRQDCRCFYAEGMSPLEHMPTAMAKDASKGGEVHLERVACGYGSLSLALDDKVPDTTTQSTDLNAVEMTRKEHDGTEA
ncbi:hypothetical protein K458DRAFT_396047 [Lentithecium fluviatile CBS 122367]|uniref:Uncharacterized protein n=1 Tax=Lentithecium fluviatile CBS 122367 TaxID=1168545 RepID=A0A6G1IH34_9PLEO|nr:hypothetical protein K458DRAFT_396047 [Lentithecium fluviatile CBS 122367]